MLSLTVISVSHICYSLAVSAFLVRLSLQRRMPNARMKVDMVVSALNKPADLYRKVTVEASHWPAACLIGKAIATTFGPS